MEDKHIILLSIFLHLYFILNQFIIKTICYCHNFIYIYYFIHLHYNNLCKIILNCYNIIFIILNKVKTLLYIKFKSDSI